MWVNNKTPQRYTVGYRGAYTGIVHIDSSIPVNIPIQSKRNATHSADFSLDLRFLVRKFQFRVDVHANIFEAINIFCWIISHEYLGWIFILFISYYHYLRFSMIKWWFIVLTPFINDRKFPIRCFQLPKFQLSSKVAKFAGWIGINLTLIFCIKDLFLCDSYFLRYSQF